MRPDAQDQFRQPSHVDDRDYVRVEYDGNKYYVPRSELVRKRPALSWAWWLLAAFCTCLVASLIIERFL